ncbi:MAG: hypothetical protein WC292_02985 [Clostridia bacterium]
MNSILTMLRLELKSKFGLGKEITPKSVVSFLINLFFSLVIYTVYIVGVYFIAGIMVSGNVPLKYEFLVIVSGVSVVVQTVVCTSAFVKNLYYSGDNELLLRFPVDGKQIFFAKSIYVYIYNLMISFVFTFPVFVIYGYLTNAGAAFYVTAVPFTIFLTVLPFCLSNLIALPVINLTNLIKNRFALILALLIIIVVSGFALYMLLLKGVLEYAQNKTQTILTEDFLAQIRGVASSMFPFNLYANVLYGNKVLLSFLYLLLLNAAVVLGAFFAAGKSVYPIVLKSIERGSESFELKTEDKVRPVFIALLRKEYVLIFRSLNYSFQYLAMAITAPIMIYFCNDLASSIGDASVGGRIVPGLTLLVVIIFITIIVSFASTAISREGNTFYLTKIMPVSYKYQVLVKLSLYFVVATLSVLVSCIVVGSVFGGEKYGNNVGFGDMAAIFFISEFLIVALSASAMISDIKSPSFDVSAAGDLVAANKNVSVNIFSGCVIAVVYGLAAMVFSYVPLVINGVTIIKNINTVYVILLIVSALMAAGLVLSLFLKLDKRYNKIKSN